MYPYDKIGKKQEGKEEWQLINTEETGEDSPLRLNISTDMLAWKVKAEILSSYTVIFRDTESGMSF